MAKRMNNRRRKRKLKIIKENKCGSVESIERKNNAKAQTYSYLQ